MVPFYAVLLRLVLFLGIGIVGISLFPEIGAPIIAIAELALLIEAIILLVWLSRRTHEALKTNTAIVKGLISALIGGIVTYLIAFYLPGGAIVTALIGMVVGGLVALTIVWSEAKQLFKL
jgi:O-antigen/teichoic acid export membrane protein